MSEDGMIKVSMLSTHYSISPSSIVEMKNDIALLVKTEPDGCQNNKLQRRGDDKKRFCQEKSNIARGRPIWDVYLWNSSFRG